MNSATNPKSLYSVLIWQSSSGCLACGPVGVERVAGDRERLLTDRLERLGGALARLLGHDELGEVLRRDGPHLEVHHRVVRAAELGAAPDVRPGLVDGDL